VVAPAGPGLEELVSTFPPADFVVPRTMVCAALLRMDELGAHAHLDVLEDVLVFALRRDPDAIRDFVAEMLLSERRTVRLWASTHLLHTLRTWNSPL
jgi:hypothetical protein